MSVLKLVDSEFEKSGLGKEYYHFFAIGYMTKLAEDLYGDIGVSKTLLSIEGFIQGYRAAIPPPRKGFMSTWLEKRFSKGYQDTVEIFNNTETRYRYQRK